MPPTAVTVTCGVSVDGSSGTEQILNSGGWGKGWTCGRRGNGGRRGKISLPWTQEIPCSPPSLQGDPKYSHPCLLVPLTFAQASLCLEPPGLVYRFTGHYPNPTPSGPPPALLGTMQLGTISDDRAGVLWTASHLGTVGAGPQPVPVARVIL